MTKRKKLFESAILILSCIAMLICGYKGKNLYPITTAYTYPILPGSEEWNKFSSLEERVTACQVPEEILYKMSTDALVETVVSCPIVMYMYAHNSVEFGYNQVKGYFNGLHELSKREDALDELKEYQEVIDEKDINSAMIVRTLIEQMEIEVKGEY